MRKKKLLITNLAYADGGDDRYVTLFLNNHLKSMLDPSNIPAFKERVEYIVFADATSAARIREHHNWKALGEVLGEDRVDIVEMVAGGFNDRYDNLNMMFRESVKFAMESSSWCSALVADLVMAQGYMASVFDKLDAGFDSVFMLPLRAAVQGKTMQLTLDSVEYALPAMDLFFAGYNNLHPLWVACHWGAAQFTTMPFSLLWNSGTGLLARTFSITPIAFTPYPEMVQIAGVIDVTVPHLCQNPYWVVDWTECPVIGVEPVECYYPPFDNHRANAKLIGGNFTKCLHPSQVGFLERRLYYPTKYHADIAEVDERESDLHIGEIIRSASGVR